MTLGWCTTALILWVWNEQALQSEPLCWGPKEAGQKWQGGVGTEPALWVFTNLAVHLNAYMPIQQEARGSGNGIREWSSNFQESRLLAISSSI